MHQSMYFMKVSIITAVYNRVHFISNSFNSLYTQTWPSIRHIIIDGESTDGSLELVNRLIPPQTILISEPDNGLYSALNKGLSFADGDIIGFLHCDDFFANEFVIQKIVALFEETNADCVYGDLQYISRETPHRIVRYWKSGEFSFKKLQRGWMPPHPTLFVKNEIYQKIGGFNENYRISADYDFILRLLSTPEIKIAYLPEVITKMCIGGKSNTFKNIILKSAEDYIALKHNHVGGMRSLLLKNISKIPQFFHRI